MFIHAKTFVTRWGLALAYLDNDDDYESETLKIRVWAPLCDDGSLAVCELKLGLESGSEASLEAMDQANRSAIETMNTERIEKTFAAARFASTLDEAFARYPQPD